MNRPRTVALTAAAALLTALAGCAATRSNAPNADLEHSAAALKQNAWVFASRSQDEGPRFAADASLLQQQAYDFNTSVESGDASDVKAKFNRLSQTYQAVQNDVQRRDTTEARTNLQPLTQAYQDVESRMQGYTGGSAGG
jgi:outer membrane murein-binding lipoprotein Lpp